MSVGLVGLLPRDQEDDIDEQPYLWSDLLARRNALALPDRSVVLTQAYTQAPTEPVLLFGAIWQPVFDLGLGEPSEASDRS